MGHGHCGGFGRQGPVATLKKFVGCGKFGRFGAWKRFGGRHCRRFGRFGFGFGYPQMRPQPPVPAFWAFAPPRPYAYTPPSFFGARPWY
jgi:hypothetical protein